MSFLKRKRPRRSPSGHRHLAALTWRWRKSLIGLAAFALVIVPLAISPAANAATAKPVSATAAAQSAHNPTPELWPKLAPFKTVAVVTLGPGATGEDQLAATTLEGAYNQRQGLNRLYVVWNPDDQTSLSVLRGIRWSPVQNQGTGPAGALATMLADYGHDIKGAIVDNPSDPDTVNLATTMAGIDDAMVADPSQIPLLHQYHIPGGPTPACRGPSRALSRPSRSAGRMSRSSWNCASTRT